MYGVQAGQASRMLPATRVRGLDAVSGLSNFLACPNRRRRWQGRFGLTWLTGIPTALTRVLRKATASLAIASSYPGSGIDDPIIIAELRALLWPTGWRCQLC